MKNKYIVPKMQVRLVHMEAFILSTTNYRKTMIMSDDNPIQNEHDILTKERSLFDEKNSSEWSEW